MPAFYAGNMPIARRISELFWLLQVTHALLDHTVAKWTFPAGFPLLTHPQSQRRSQKFGEKLKLITNRSQLMQLGGMPFLHPQWTDLVQ